MIISAISSQSGGVRRSSRTPTQPMWPTYLGTKKRSGSALHEDALHALGRLERHGGPVLGQHHEELVAYPEGGCGVIAEGFLDGLGQGEADGTDAGDGSAAGAHVVVASCAARSWATAS